MHFQSNPNASGKQVEGISFTSYLDKWKDANIEMLDDVGLGKDCGEEGVGPERRFLSGIFLSVSAARTTVHYCKWVYQTDAAHT
jgi:hypothetical protein